MDTSMCNDKVSKNGTELKSLLSKRRDESEKRRNDISKKMDELCLDIQVEPTKDFKQTGLKFYSPVQILENPDLEKGMSKYNNLGRARLIFAIEKQRYNDIIKSIDGDKSYHLPKGIAEKLDIL